MLKNLLRVFLAGAIGGIIYNLIGGLLTTYLPSLPFGFSSAIVLGILVLIVDYILQNVARL